MDDLSPNQANRLSGAQGYWGTAFVLALIAHGLLFVLLFVSMQWRSEPTGPVYAELWNGDMPAAEAPAETQPEPQPEPEPEPAKPTASQASGYIGSSASALEGALGSPSSKTYSPSCMGEGEDGVWTYSGFTVYTYRENGVETVEAVS